MVKHLDLRTEIDGWQASRGAVLEWEAKRLKVVLKFLGAPVAETETDVDELRRRLYELKRIIGPSTLERRVAMRTRVGNAVSAAAAKAAKGERVASSITVRVPSGSAEVFADWFTAESALVDSDAMLAACPDHYFIGEDSRGRQKVIETTGGSPLPTGFFIDYGDIFSLSTPASPEYPIQIAGVARTAGGYPIGGVRHQFRDLPGGGFESWNTVEFPKNVGRRLVEGHQWHLACEFGNWIEFQQNGF